VRTLGDVFNSFWALCQRNADYSADSRTVYTYHDAIVRDYVSMKGRELVADKFRDVRLYNDAEYSMFSKMYTPPSSGAVSWFLPRTEEDLLYIGTVWGNCISGYAHAVRMKHSVVLISLLDNMPYLAIEIGVNNKTFIQAELPMRTRLSDDDMAHVRIAVEYSGGIMKDDKHKSTTCGLTTVSMATVCLPSSIEGGFMSDSEYKQCAKDFHAKHEESASDDASAGIDPVMNQMLPPYGGQPAAPIGVPFDTTDFAVDDQHWIDNEGMDDIPF